MFTALLSDLKILPESDLSCFYSVISLISIILWCHWDIAEGGGGCILISGFRVFANVWHCLYECVAGVCRHTQLWCNYCVIADGSPSCSSLFLFGGLFRGAGHTQRFCECRLVVVCLRLWLIVVDIAGAGWAPPLPPARHRTSIFEVLSGQGTLSLGLSLSSAHCSVYVRSFCGHC